MTSKQKAPTPRLAAVAQKLAFCHDACRACRACEMACALSREGSVSPSLACINIALNEFATDAVVTARFCLQCVDAPCIDACPVKAMARHPRTGAVMIDAETCIGCMRCAKACPWAIPKRHPDHRLAIKCDLCSDIPTGPACVQFCPLAGEALAVTSLHEKEINA